jgi:hypothetical protein
MAIGYDSRSDFVIEMLDGNDRDNRCLDSVMFSNESAFNLSGYVNKQNTLILGAEKPNAITEFQWGSPKITVRCGLMCNRVIGPFFPAETAIATCYSDILENFAVPQVEDLQSTVACQQAGTPPHWAPVVRRFLDEKFPGRWIGRDGQTIWPPRSTDITPFDLFSLGLCKRQGVLDSHWTSTNST